MRYIKENEFHKDDLVELVEKFSELHRITTDLVNNHNIIDCLVPVDKIFPDIINGIILGFQYAMRDINESYTVLYTMTDRVRMLIYWYNYLPVWDDMVRADLIISNAFKSDDFYCITPTYGKFQEAIFKVYKEVADAYNVQVTEFGSTSQTFGIFKNLKEQLGIESDAEMISFINGFTKYNLPALCDAGEKSQNE